MTEKIWKCKIGGDTLNELPPGSDLHMRIAIKKAYREITGQEPEFLFSGWGAELTPTEREVAKK